MAVKTAAGWQALTVFYEGEANYKTKYYSLLVGPALVALPCDRNVPGPFSNLNHT